MMNDFKNKVHEKIKEYSNDDYLNGYINNEYSTNDNDADIYLKVREKDDVIDRHTTDNQIALRDDVYEYLEKKSSMLESDIPINLHIIGYEFTSKEQGVIKHLVKEHYSIELYKIQKEYKKTRNKAIILIVTGLVCLAIYLYLVLILESTVMSEIFVFLFTFSLWEAFHSIIYILSDVKDKREAITQNLLTNVDFVNKGEEIKDTE
jgi:hypothetical protein